MNAFDVKLRTRCEHCNRELPIHGKFCPKAAKTEEVTVHCPEDGIVKVRADQYHKGMPVSGFCPGHSCRVVKARLYFDESPASQILCRS